MTSIKRTSYPFFLGILAVSLGIGLAPSTPARAGDWSFSISVPGYYYWCEDPYWVYDPGYAPVWDYYPNYNPVIERDVYYNGHRHHDGTHHSERTVEDRRASYYSPGRNEAITPPRTTVEEYGGPGFHRDRERTSWIGADGRPHSTTIDRVTTVDPWGNSHTDTHVTLKNRGKHSNPVQSQMGNQAPNPKVPNKVKNGKHHKGHKH